MTGKVYYCRLFFKHFLDLLKVSHDLSGVDLQIIALNLIYDVLVLLERIQLLIFNYANISFGVFLS